jgi:hypothetical protein
MEPFASLFGPVDALLAPYIEYVLVVLVLANVGARALEYRSIVSQAREGGAEAVSRGAPRVATNMLLLFTSFYFTTVEYHAGMVLSTLVVGLVLTDLFEFESRLVEARQGIDIERPKGSIVASVLVVLYVGYTAFFFLLSPFWNSVI